MKMLVGALVGFGFAAVWASAVAAGTIARYNVYLSADGEIDGPHHCMEWDLQAGAVQMYLPRD